MKKIIECLRCKGDMHYLKEYKFDSQDSNRGFFGDLFEVEEHLSFDVYVCPKCRHTEFFYTGATRKLD